MVIENEFDQQKYKGQKSDKLRERYVHRHHLPSPGGEKKYLRFLRASKSEINTTRGKGGAMEKLRKQGSSTYRRTAETVFGVSG